MTDAARLWRIRNSERWKAIKRKSYYLHRQEILARIKLSPTVSRHRPANIEYLKRWRKKNPDYMKNWSAKNKVSRRNYHKMLYQNDPDYRIGKCLRSRILAALNGKSKSKNTMQLIGCSVESLWLYLESKFELGMKRENYGTVWQIDHIIPCAIFDLSKPEHQQRCFHFSNLQPLYSEENHKKSDNIIMNQFSLL